MRVRLRRIVLVNFRTFKGRHEIVLPEAGLVILKGMNLDTGGQSGAGKTNVLLAIAYAFGFCPHPAAALKCWYADDLMSVEIYMDTADGEAVLVRGEKGQSLKIGTQKKVTGAKAVEEHLDRLCGVDSGLREILTYRDQRKPKKFLSMKDAELKEFLTSVLGLHGLEKEIEASVKRLGPLEQAAKQAEQNTIAADKALVERQAEVPSLEEASTADGEILLKVTESELEVKSILKTRLKQQEASEKAQLERMAAKSAEEVKAATEALRAQERAVRIERVLVDDTEKERLLDLRNTAVGHVGKVTAQIAEAQKKYDAETRVLQMDLRHLHNELVRIPSLLADLDRLKREAEKLAANTCPTCERTWDNARAQAAILAGRITQLENELETIRAHQAPAKALEQKMMERRFVPDPKLERLKEVLAKIESDLFAETQRKREIEHEHQIKVERRCAAIREQISAVIAEHAEKNAGAAAKQNQVIDDIRKQIADLDTEIINLHQNQAQLQQTLALTRQHNANLRKNHEQALERVEQAKKRMLEVAAADVAATATYRRESDYLDLLRGFRNKIFDEVLDAVGVESSEIIGGLPNAQHITIEFQSERETGAGTTKHEIKPVTYVHGEPRPLASSVSGGQFTSIELAVDLAVRRVISRRLGCQLDWIILDESFNGHDPITKEACLTLLNQYAADTLVMIVDHTSEFKELFQQEIVVEYEDKLSRIQP